MLIGFDADGDQKNLHHKHQLDNSENSFFHYIPINISIVLNILEINFNMKTCHLLYMRTRKTCSKAFIFSYNTYE